MAIILGLLLAACSVAPAQPAQPPTATDLPTQLPPTIESIITWTPLPSPTQTKTYTLTLPILTFTQTQTLTPTLTATSTTAPTLAATAAILPTATQAPPAAICDCNRDYDCKDFTTQRKAQACFNSCGGSATRNWSRLDGSDKDGKVCESLP